MDRIYRVLTIAGSDSGGGAGIQADLKTFVALGVYGMSAITSITAQNTISVTAIQDLRPMMIRAQIRAVAEDIGIDTVAEELKKHHFPIVVDPVMVAKSGAKLLRPRAVDSLISEVLPITTVLTPNAPEAEALAGVEVRNIDSAREAAKKISELGPKAVVVKGGHIPQDDKIIDVLFYQNRFHTFDTRKLDSRSTHGTGCTFSAAIAAELAKGKGVVEAVEVAQRFVAETIRFGFPLGHGHGPVNQLASLYRECERYAAIRNLTEAVDTLESSPEVAELIPETNSNLVMGLPYAESHLEVVGIPGRIVRTMRGVRASSCPRFGASKHVANTVLAVMRYDPKVRAGMNIRYSEKILEVCGKVGLVTSFYDRREEPAEVKKIEGMTTRWGAEEAIRRVGGVPDAIYHTGDWGKEPMITLLGKDALRVAETAVKIAKEMVGACQQLC